MILNSIRAAKVKFGPEYGELVIAMDSREGYWRRDVFPYYKAKRKEGRDASDINWPQVFEAFNQIKQELEEYFPYKTIKIKGAEADDIIAVLTKKYHSQGVLILANDHDFIQLHKFPNVKQWNPVMKKWIREKDPERYLQEHILRGDRGDGIPSVREADNTLVIESTGRRAPISKKMIDTWLAGNDTKLTMNAELYRNWIRNRELIDFEYIPEHISDQILNAYENHPTPDRSRLFGYFIQHRLRNLMPQISDF
jgi:hypothetical protein